MYKISDNFRENKIFPNNEKIKFPILVINESSSLPPSFKYLDEKTKSRSSQSSNFLLKYLGSKDPSALNIQRYSV